MFLLFDCALQECRFYLGLLAIGGPGLCRFPCVNQLSRLGPTFSVNQYLLNAVNSMSKSSCKTTYFPTDKKVFVVVVFMVKTDSQIAHFLITVNSVKTG